MAVGVRLTMSTRNTAGIVANLYAADARMRRAVRALVVDTGEREYQRAYDLAPKDTHFMAEHLTLRITDEGYAYELGYNEDDFTAEGFAFYPLYQEFGTSKMAAQPSLFPARDEIRPEFQQRLRAAVKDAIRRRGSRR